jgi:hypothetical protein
MKKYILAGLAVTGTALCPLAHADDVLPDLADAGNTYIASPTGDFLQYPGYLSQAESLYLAPLGDTGPYTPLDLPTSFSYATDVPQGEAQIVTQVLADNPTADNPDVFFGYSDSSVQMSGAEALLAADGVCQQCVDFVFVGDTSSPDGYIANFLDTPSIEPLATLLGYGPIEGIVTPDNLFPTEVITINGDEYADYLGYNWLSDAFTHWEYMGLTPDEIASGTLTTEGLTSYLNIALDSTQQWDALINAADLIYGW